LQGARALARQGAGAAGGRPQGGGRAHRLHPPPRQREAADDAARCRARRARGRSGTAGCAAAQAGGVTGRQGRTLLAVAALVLSTAARSITALPPRLYRLAVAAFPT